MARLTITTKEIILKKLLKHRFLKEAETVNKEYKRLAEVIYNDLLTKKEHEILESLPKEWVPETNNILIRFGDNVQYLKFSGNNLVHRIHNLLEVSKKSPVVLKKIPYKYTGKFSPKVLKTYEPSSKLFKKWEKINNKQMELRADVINAEVEASAIIDTVNTDKKLLEIWPEIEPFLPKQVTTKKLPIVLPAAINKTFKLPVPSNKNKE